jgi:hypothetical protein
MFQRYAIIPVGFDLGASVAIPYFKPYSQHFPPEGNLASLRLRGAFTPQCRKLPQLSGNKLRVHKIVSESGTLLPNTDYDEVGCNASHGKVLKKIFVKLSVIDQSRGEHTRMSKIHPM